MAFRTLDSIKLGWGSCRPQPMLACYKLKCWPQPLTAVLAHSPGEASPRDSFAEWLGTQLFYFMSNWPQVRAWEP